MAGWIAMRITRANDGTARAALAALITTKLPRHCGLGTAPTTTPTTVAATTATADSSAWWPKFRRMPEGPVQLEAVVKNPATWEMKFTGRPPVSEATGG